MVEKSLCEVTRYKSKSASKIEKLTGKISFAQIDELNNKKFLHYCAFQGHPGTIGQNVLYERVCLSGCSYYKRFIEEDVTQNYTPDNDFVKRGAPEKDKRILKPQISRKKKKINYSRPDALERTIMSMRPKVKSGINPYVKKPKEKKKIKKHIKQKILRENQKRNSKLEEISHDPTIIGLPQVGLTEFNYDPKQNTIPQYDLLFENQNEIFIFALRSNSYSKSKSKQTEKPKNDLKTLLTKEIEKISIKYPNKIVYAIFGNKEKITKKRKGTSWNTTLFKEK